MDFTPRQLEILKLLARDHNHFEIARRLNVSLLMTARVIRLLAAKLEAKTTAELRGKAREIT